MEKTNILGIAVIALLIMNIFGYYQNYQLQRQIGINGEYDLAGTLVSAQEWQKANEARVAIFFKVPAQGLLTNDFIQLGNGVVVSIKGKVYILTSARLALNPLYFEPYNIGEMYAEASWIKEANDNVTLVSLERVVTNVESDLVLYKVPDELKNKAVPLGNSDELKVGTFIIFSGGPYPYIRDGTISNLRGPAELELYVDALNKFLEMELTINDLALLSMAVIPQEDGSPAFAARDGKLELVGILFAAMPYAYVLAGHPEPLEGFGIMTKINAMTGSALDPETVTVKKTVTNTVTVNNTAIVKKTVITEETTTVDAIPVGALVFIAVAVLALAVSVFICTSGIRKNQKVAK